MMAFTQHTKGSANRKPVMAFVALLILLLSLGIVSLALDQEKSDTPHASDITQTPAPAAGSMTAEPDRLRFVQQDNYQSYIDHLSEYQEWPVTDIEGDDSFPWPIPGTAERRALGEVFRTRFGQLEPPRSWSGFGLLPFDEESWLRSGVHRKDLSWVRQQMEEGKQPEPYSLFGPSRMGTGGSLSITATRQYYDSDEFDIRGYDAALLSAVVRAYVQVMD